MKTRKLRRLTPQNAEMIVNLHDDIFAVCVALLNAQRYFILEDAVIRADRRRLRDHIQWDVITAWLEEEFGHPLAAHHRGSLRRMTKAAFNKLRVTKDVGRYLEYGNGNQTAGYGFLGWPDRQTSERQIAARHHVADGIHNSADRLEVSLTKVTRVPAIEGENDGETSGRHDG